MNLEIYMMNFFNKAKKGLSAALLVCLLATTGCTAMAESSFQAVVTSKTMKVYATSGSHKYLGSLARGTEVTVLDYKKGIAKISYKGNTGLAYVKDMDAVEDDAEEVTQSTPAVALKNMKVYKKASTSSASVTIKKGTTLNILAVNGKVAKVEKDGVIGYAYVENLGDPDDLKADETPVTTLNVPVVTTQSTKIYKKASTSSKYTTVAKGTAMTLVALNGECAKVEKDGVVGYTFKSHLSEKTDAPTVEEPVATPAPTPTTPPVEDTSKKEESSSPLFNSSASNEQITYQFLTKVAGYNSAAAIGIMANIKYESGYKPVSNGDSGNSYGICQWNSGRKTRLINWCTENGYDHSTLEGQLYFLQYELTHSYTKVHNYLKGVSNTAEGAYDAGYYFCYHFEGPSNKASKSVTRGNYAKDTLWERYN